MIILKTRKRLSGPGVDTVFININYAGGPLLRMNEPVPGASTGHISLQG